MTSPSWRRAAAASRSRRAFGRTWWGAAWVEALEGRARLDPNRLPRGRRYARSGAVGDMVVDRGEVRAPVQGSRAKPYAVRVRVRQLDPGEWDRLLDAVVARAAHAAALLDGELPPEVVTELAAAGIDLLPGPGEVGPRCSCPDWADPCKHAAAVCYLVADVLDDDPFGLLLLRGRTKDEVLAGLRRRRSSPSPRGTGGRAGTGAGTEVDEGAEARVVWARGQVETAEEQPGLPDVPVPPPHPGRPATLAVDPPASAAVRRGDLSDLAADAARRAWELCTGEGDGGLGLAHEADLARLAAGRLGGDGLGELAARAGVSPRALVGAASAWRDGGAGAVEVRSLAWSPPPDALEEGRAALSPSGPVRAWRNRLTQEVSGTQLRLGRDGLWYRFERLGTAWELAGAPDADPARLLPGSA